MQLPVIISDAGGMKYGIMEGETGFVIKEKDLNAFADKIEYLLKNPDLREKLGEKGREFVVENYDTKVLGNRLEVLYFELLQK